MRFASLLVACTLAASPALAQRSAAASRRPLDRLVAEPILVLPVQYLVFADSLGWVNRAPATREYLASLDDEITFALSERGLKGRWKFADDATRAAAHNPGFVADPHALAAGELRAGRKMADASLPEPLGSELRTLVAMTDARYVLFPVEVTMHGANGNGYATMHVVIIDTRLYQVAWAGDIQGERVANFSPAIAADLASRLADIIIAPSS